MSVFTYHYVWGHFYAVFNTFEYKIFLHAILRLESPVCPTMNRSREKNDWIYTFSKGIIAIWNANCLV